MSTLASHFLIVASCLLLHHSSAGFSVTQQQLSAWKDSSLSVSHPVSRIQMGWEPALFSVFCSCTLLALCPRILAWYSNCFSNSESFANRTFYLHQLPTCMQDCFAGFLKRHFCFSPGNRPVCLCFQKESSSSWFKEASCSILTLIYFSPSVCECFACMFVCVPHACSVYNVQKRTSEQQILVSCCVDSETQPGFSEKVTSILNC